MPNDNYPNTPKDDVPTPITIPPTSDDPAGVVNTQDSPPTQTDPQIPPTSTIQESTTTGNTSPPSSTTLNSVVEPNIVTTPHAPQKYGGGKVIATIFGILLLIGGVTAGVVLVQRQQQIAEKATSGSECQQNPNCILLENPGNSGSYEFPRTINAVQITAQEGKTYQPGLTEDGCFRVNIESRFLTWHKYGEGPNCKDISNIQAKLGQDNGPTNTPTTPEEPTSPPEITQPPNSDISASCSGVIAYNTNWNQLTQAQLDALETGSKVRFAVSGTASSGTFDKARFTVNETELPETTLKKPDSEEFYVEYTIPAGVTNFTVSAQIHHSELGWF